MYVMKIVDYAALQADRRTGTPNLVLAGTTYDSLP